MRSHRIKTGICVIAAGISSLLTTLALLHGRGIQGDNLLYSMAFLGLFAGYGQYFQYGRDREKAWIYWIPAFVFAGFGVAGHLYLRELPGSLIRQAICFLGYGIFYHTLIQCLIWLLEGERIRPLSGKLWDRFEQHAFGITLMLTVLFWAVPFAVKYPAGFCMDAMTELRLYFKEWPLMNQHPTFHVMLLGSFYEFGLALGSKNLGFFLFVLVQVGILALTVSYGISLLVRLRVPGIWTILAMAWFLLSPFVTGYLGVVIKDAYFVTFFLLYIIMTVELAATGEAFWKSRRKLLLLILGALGMALSRVNVLLLLIPSAVAMIGSCWKQEKGRVRSALLLLVVLVPLLANMTVTAIYQPIKSGRRESYSLPLQQTARFARDHGDQVTEEEKQIISKLVDYDLIAGLYDPYLSDPVKGIFNELSTQEEMADYFGVWFRQLLREPGCYLASFMQQNVFLFYPEYNNYTYYFDHSIVGDYVDPVPGLDSLRNLGYRMTCLLHELPVLTLINNSALGCMLFVVLCFYAGKKRLWNQFSYLLPRILVLTAILLGPTIRENARYTFPILYTLPIILPALHRAAKQG